MISEPSQTSTAEQVRRLREQDRGRRESLVLNLLLLLPWIGYVGSLWLVRPLSLTDTFSLTLAAPGLLLIAIAALRLPRDYLLGSLRDLRWESSLLAFLAVMSVLSLVNAEEPIRGFRIIFPSLVPFAIYAHLIVVRYHEPRFLEWTPRILIASALLFSTFPLLLSMVFPPARDYLFGVYRMRGFLENSIQHSIALAVVLPLAINFLLASKGLRNRAIGIVIVVAIAYTLFRAGSKTALAVSLAFAFLLYAIVAIRSRKATRILVASVISIAIGLFLYFFGLPLAEMINPIMAEKLRSVFEGGVTNYQSIESRRLLWDEAIEQGKRHWLIGSGAGEKVLGVSHAHNLVLDYFKSIGVFGATAVTLLCLTIFTRTLAKGFSVARGRGGGEDILAFACYLSATVYTICNQLSDSFGPSTVGFLWTVYLTGFALDRRGWRRQCGRLAS